MQPKGRDLLGCWQGWGGVHPHTKPATDPNVTMLNCAGRHLIAGRGIPCNRDWFRRQMAMAAHYYTVTWDQLHRDARALAWRLMGSGPFAGIVAISRGGLIPAAIIARELDLRLVESICVVTYQDEARGEPIITKPAVAAGDGTGFLIV